MKNNPLQKPDKELLVWERFRQGDQEAFATLFELSSDRLYRYGIKFVRDEELVKDCIQDLFIKLHQNRSNLPDVNNLLFYLFKALRNLLVDAIQQNEKMVYFSPEELPFHVQFVFDPNKEDVEEEIKEKLEKVIRCLSDRQKEAIYLRYQNEMSYDEIAKLMGINNQSVRNIIHRSLEKIRAEMDLSVFIALIISCIK
jgi:RNA polymerase sigma factor (sigma-70 family)